MKNLKRISVLFALTASCFAQAQQDGWISLFDGNSLNGWKASENAASWKVENGAIVANAKPRSHLFYMGEQQPFSNFDFEAEVMTRSNSNGGIYFHTEYQATDWPKKGFECQVNNTYVKDPVKTGSLYHVKDVTQAPAKDDEWFRYRITVQGKHVVIRINDKVAVDYTEPEGKTGKSVADKGTFALQAHDPKSVVLYKNLRVKRLP